jgi:hypothetical protein
MRRDSYIRLYSRKNHEGYIKRDREKRSVKVKLIYVLSQFVFVVCIWHREATLTISLSFVVLRLSGVE